MMEAIVLAGGFGTRLRNVVQDVPKPMAPVAGKPFLEILLTSLEAKGVRRVVLSVGYLADSIKKHFGSTFRTLAIDYEVEDAPLGTGGAVRAAIAHCTGDHVLVLNGDTFLDVELQTLELTWQRLRRPMIVARPVEDAARYGRLLVKNGLVIGFAEKGAAGPGLINAGCYILPRDVLSSFPLYKPFSLETDFFIPLVSGSTVSPVAVFVTEGLFIDIGVPDDYFRAQTLLAPFAA